MVKTLELTAELPESRELILRLPEDIPAGTIHLFVQVVPDTEHLENLRELEEADRILAEARRDPTYGLHQLTDAQRDALFEALLEAGRDVAAGAFLTHEEMRAKWLGGDAEAA